MDADEYPSLTWGKARVLPRVFRAHPNPELVLALGTAACPKGSGFNGSVAIGSRVFVHDPYKTPPTPSKNWTHAELNRIVDSKGLALLGYVSKQYSAEVEKRLLTPPLGAACPPRVELGAELVSLGVVNVTNPDDYKWADPQALKTFEAAAPKLTAASSETTHGVIRLCSEAPYLFVSGFANAIGKFAEEVVPRKYTQNFVAAHNAAVTAAWLLREVLR